MAKKPVETTAQTAAETVKQAFAPITEAVQNIQNSIQVPEAARDFVKKAATAGEQRAAALNANVEKATDSVESAAVAVVNEIATVSRNVQKAMHEDVAAYFANLGKLATAKCPSEAMQIQADYLRGRGEVAVSRVKAASAYVGEKVKSGVKSAQDNLAQFGKTAA
ncbi:MAG TPA: phasin family protein [Beijerinckiaceae bacterium]|nr:phasin family protein [Beijerinckiaceae bacterium]